MRRPVFVALALVVATAASACDDTYETAATQNPLSPEELDDTAPPEAAYDPELAYMGRHGVEENHSSERFRFDVMPYADDAERSAGDELFPSHAAFLAARGGYPKVIPSVQTIGTTVKQLDDTIYAGVERTLQDGLAPSLEPKRALLEGALDQLAQVRSQAGDEALVHVAAALRLGGANPNVPSDLSGRVAAYEAEFLAAEEESKPIGFYTWSEALGRIWKQDRLLQRLLPRTVSCALATAIGADAKRRAQYVTLVSLYAKLTNPLESSLLDLLPEAVGGRCRVAVPAAFLSASRTPEVELFEALYPGGIPAGADLMKDLIQAIRDGRVDLAPRPEDGWYQHQLYALETLLVTDKSEERRKIGFTARYKKRLQEAFKTMLVQHRETHVKQADTAEFSMGSAEPPIPHFRLEPLATVYVRHARSYVMLEAALEALLGATVLDTAVAVGASGGTTHTLRQQLTRARELFYGLYLLSAQDIGLRPTLGAGGDPGEDERDALAKAADEWLMALESDPSAGSDVRVMVPIASLEPGRAKYWAVIGVRGTLAGYSYLEGADMNPPTPDRLAKVWLPTEQFLEVDSSDVPLTREELRALCDAQRTPEAIRAALEAR